MLTQVVAGRVFDISHEVWGDNWGTRPPVAITVGEGDAVYVANRGLNYSPNVPCNRTIRGNGFSKLSVGENLDEDELFGEFGKDGDAPRELIWLAGLALNNDENVYVTDKWLNRISIFDKKGIFLRAWGSAWDSKGKVKGPSGIAVDQQDDLCTVDSRNHRIQKFTKDGQFLGTWVSFGKAEGELDSL
jgi:DNA-binding beta-propeller fold protein YncE